MTPSALDRLRAPAFAPLVDELAHRFSAGDTPVTITLPDAPHDTQRAVADAFGLDKLPAPPIRLRVDRLLVALHLASVSDLRAVVETLRGPLPDRRTEREADRAARSHLWAWLTHEAHAIPLFGADASADAWVDAQRTAGVRGGLALHRRRLEQAVDVLRALPADGISLAVLADRHAAGPHALDRGRALAAVVLDGIAIATGNDRLFDAESVRALWESVGVVPDQLSSTVLTLGLRGDDDSSVGQFLAAAAALAEPVVLTLAQLRRWPRPPLERPQCAFVFENPSVIAEAARDAWAGPPLICSSGRPTVAVLTLVRQLRSNGATVYQHADFDPAGIAITAWLADRAGTTPWQMTSDAYRQGVRSAGAIRFDDTVPDTPWNPPLKEAMNGEQVAVYEESLTHLLPGIGAASLGSRRDHTRDPSD